MPKSNPAHEDLAKRFPELEARVGTAAALQQLADEGKTTPGALRHALKRRGLVQTTRTRNTPARVAKSITEELTLLTDLGLRAAEHIDELRTEIKDRDSLIKNLNRELSSKKEAAELEELRPRFREAIQALSEHLPKMGPKWGQGASNPGVSPLSGDGQNPDGDGDMSELRLGGVDG